MANNDFNTLTVLIEANTKAYERAMVRLEGKTQAALLKIKNNTNKTKKSMSGLERAIEKARKRALRLGTALALAFVTRDMVRFMDAASRIENSLKIAGLEGKELNKVYNALFESSQKSAAPLEALATLYNRGALAQKDLGASSDDLIRFTDNVAKALRVAGKSASESRGALIQLSQAIGAGIVRAEEFNAILEGALPIAQATAAGYAGVGGSVSQLRRLIIDGKVTSKDFFDAFLRGSHILDEKVESAVFTLGQRVIKLGNALTFTAGKFDDLTGTSEGLGFVLDELTEATTWYGKKFEEFGGNIEGVEAKLDSTTQSANNLKDALMGLSKVPIAKELTDAEFLRLGGRRDMLNGDGMDALKGSTYNDRVIGAHEVQQAKIEKPKTPKKAQKTDAQSDRERKIKELERETEAYDQLLSRLTEEINLVGASEVELQKSNNTRSLGASITDEQRQNVELLTEKLYEQQQAWEASAQAQDFFANQTFDAISGIIDGSKTAKDAILDLAKGIAQAALQATLLGSGPLAGVMGTGGGGGGVLGSIMSSIAGNGAPMVLGRASGGPVQKGRPYKVGERGEELFVPNTAGKIMNNHNTQQAGGGGMAIAVTVNGARGNSEIEAMVRSGVSQGISSFSKKGGPQMARQAVARGRKYGVNG